MGIQFSKSNSGLPTMNSSKIGMAEGFGWLRRTYFGLFPLVPAH